MRRIIESGKHKGKSLDECPESYLKWLISHERVLAERNRWMSRDARFILVQRTEAAATLKTEQEMAVRVAEEIVSGNQNWDDWAEVLEASKEKEMLKSIRKTDCYGFCWQESMIATVNANKGTEFTAQEMYDALQSVSQGEEMDSLSRVQKTLEMATYAPGPIRIKKVEGGYIA